MHADDAGHNGALVSLIRPQWCFSILDQTMSHCSQWCFSILDQTMPQWCFSILDQTMSHCYSWGMPPAGHRSNRAPIAHACAVRMTVADYHYRTVSRIHTFRLYPDNTANRRSTKEKRLKMKRRSVCAQERERERERERANRKMQRCTMHWNTKGKKQEESKAGRVRVGFDDTVHGADTVHGGPTHLAEFL